MSFLGNLLDKKLPLNLTGFTDWHCHILPGVDDGVKTMEESLSILNLYEDARIQEVWLTPHIMEDIPNTTALLKERFAELKRAYCGSVKLNLAAENMMDSLFMQRLESGDLLPIGEEGKTLLVETSYFNSPVGFRDIIRTIKAKGYFPLLAHPERYEYMNSLDAYRELKDMDVRFQLNLMSLCGHYGPGVREKALKLLSAGMYDLAGTDLHRIKHLEIIRNMKLPARLVKNIGLN